MDQYVNDNLGEPGLQNADDVRRLLLDPTARSIIASGIRPRPDQLLSLPATQPAPKLL